MKILLLLTSCLVLGLFQPKLVIAQTETPSEAVLQKQRLDAEIAELTNIYRGQLAEYRPAEKDFLIAQDQYRELQTLASINKVTEAARTVMKIRGQVLLTYFELLRVRLVAAEGIELSLKSAAIPKLEEQKNWLRTHQQAIAAANDREEFNQLADEFILKEEVFQAVSQEMVSLLSVGKLQDVFDRLASIGTDLAAQEASNSVITDSRAMRETNSAIQEALISLQTIWSQLREEIQEKNVQNFYRNSTRILEPVYSDLNKLVSFLDELLRML